MTKSELIQMEIDSLVGFPGIEVDEVGARIIRIVIKINHAMANLSHFLKTKSLTKNNKIETATIVIDTKAMESMYEL